MECMLKFYHTGKKILRLNIPCALVDKKSYAHLLVLQAIPYLVISNSREHGKVCNTDKN